LKLRVYVVDDEPAICEMVGDVLSAAGIEAVTESQSARAAQRLLKEKFDAVFLDLRMPVPDGYQLAKTIRAGGFNQRSPIVLITGDDNPKVLRLGYEAGGNFFLFKPFDRRGLLRMVRASQEFIEREKRRFQRVPMRLPVRLESKSERLDGLTLDLSLNGMLVEAGRLLAANTPVEVSFHPPDAKSPVHIKASVLRVIGKNRMALIFNSMAPADNEALHRFLLPLILTQMEAGETR